MVRKESMELIRNYIISREGKATMREVVNYMQNEVPENFKLSRDTVIKQIKNMESLVITGGERQGRAYKLLIDDKKEFNRIQKRLSSIENSIDARQENDKMENKGKESFSKNKTKKGFTSSEPFDTNFEYQFVITGLILLLRSLLLINERVKSQKDSQILNDRLIKIMQKLAKHSLQKLSWNLLETDEEDLRILAISDEILKLWNR